jgi:hypothetical protein
VTCTDCTYDFGEPPGFIPCQDYPDHHALAGNPATVRAMDEDTRRELSRAANMAETWLRKRDELIRQAVAGGAGLREVARAVNLTHPSVIKIVKRGTGGD